MFYFAKLFPEMYIKQQNMINNKNTLMFCYNLFKQSN